MGPARRHRRLPSVLVLFAAATPAFAGSDSIRGAGEGALEAAIDAQIALAGSGPLARIGTAAALRSPTRGAATAAAVEAARGGDASLDAETGPGPLPGTGAGAGEASPAGGPVAVPGASSLLDAGQVGLPTPDAWRWPLRTPDAAVPAGASARTRRASGGGLFAGTVGEEPDAGSAAGLPAFLHADVDLLALHLELRGTSARVRAPLLLSEYASSLGFTRASGESEDAAAVAFSGDGRLGPFSVSHAVTRRVSARRTGAPEREESPATVAAVRVALPTDTFRPVASGFGVRGDRGGATAGPGGDDAGGPFGSALVLADPRAAVSSFLFRDAEGAFGSSGADVAASGVRVLHAGVEWDLGPRTTAFLHAARVRFDDAERLRGRGADEATVGTEVSLGIAWRPAAAEGVVLHAGVAALAPEGHLRRRTGDRPITAVYFAASFAF